MKFISVLVKAKDNLEELMKTIKSIENQQMNPKWKTEIILLKPDNCDWDKYHPQYLHQNILVLEINNNEINKEESTIWETGFRSVSGEYIAFINEGNIWTSRKLDEQIHIMDEKKIDMIYTNYIDRDRKMSSVICKNSVFKSFIKNLNWDLGLSLDTNWLL